MPFCHTTLNSYHIISVNIYYLLPFPTEVLVGAAHYMESIGIIVEINCAQSCSEKRDSGVGLWKRMTVMVSVCDLERSRDTRDVISVCSLEGE